MRACRGWILGLIAMPSLAAEPLPDSVPVTPLRSTDTAAEVAPAGPENAALPPLVVVGSRSPREIKDLSASVSVVDAERIEILGASSLGEVLGSLTGVAMEGGPRASAEFVNIRGLSGPRVLLVVDGARQNFLGGHRTSLLADPEMLKQVEVLRGPASALWGSDALGGVVVLATKDADDLLDPGETMGGRLRFGYESAADERLVSGTGALRLGALDAVLSAAVRDAGDYRRGDGEREPHTDLQVDSHLAKLSWQPGDGPHRLSLIRQGFVQQGTSPSNPATDVTETNPLIDRRNDATYHVARYRYAAGEGALSTAELTLYRDVLEIEEDRVDEPRQDRTRFETDGLNGTLSLPLPLPPLWGGDAAADSLLTWGFDGFRDRSQATRDGSPRPQFPDAERVLAGSFVQMDVPVGDLRVIPGLRYDRYRSSTRQTDDPDVTASAVSPTLGMVYALTEDLRLRAAYNSAFRAPGLIEIYAAGQHFLGNEFVPNPALRPEQARNLEAGIDLTLAGFSEDQQFRVSATVYRNQIDDFIELFVSEESEFPALRCLRPQPPVGCVNRNDDGSLNPFTPPVFVGGFTSSRNLDAATLRGGEVEARYRLGALTLGTTYSRVRGADDASGMPLLNLPADRLRGSLQIRPAWGPLRGLQAALGYTHHANQDRVPMLIDDEGNEQPVIPTTPAYGIWDLSVTYAPPAPRGWLRHLQAPRLVLGVDNLADTRFRDHLNVLESPGRNVRGSLSFGF